MLRWTIHYFPFSGENHSPEDFIASIDPAKEANKLSKQLDSLAEMEPYHWPKTWVKIVDGLYQLTSGDYRLYFDLDDDIIIVVCYVCRKKGQKANPQDLAQAHRNLAAYYQYKRSQRK